MVYHTLLCTARNQRASKFSSKCGVRFLVQSILYKIMFAYLLSLSILSTPVSPYSPDPCNADPNHEDCVDTGYVKTFEPDIEPGIPTGPGSGGRLQEENKEENEGLLEDSEPCLF